MRRESADKESLPPTVNISSYTVTNEQRKVVQGSVTRSWFPRVSNNLWISHEVMRARLWQHAVTRHGRCGVRADSSPQDSTSLSSHQQHLPIITSTGPPPPAPFFLSTTIYSVSTRAKLCRPVKRTKTGLLASWRLIEVCLSGYTD